VYISYRCLHIAVKERIYAPVLKQHHTSMQRLTRRGPLSSPGTPSGLSMQAVATDADADEVCMLFNCAKLCKCIVDRYAICVQDTLRV
jgi:hypothetical protein